MQPPGLPQIDFTGFVRGRWPLRLTHVLTSLVPLCVPCLRWFQPRGGIFNYDGGCRNGDIAPNKCPRIERQKIAIFTVK